MPNLDIRIGTDYDGGGAAKAKRDIKEIKGLSGTLAQGFSSLQNALGNAFRIGATAAVVGVTALSAAITGVVVSGTQMAADLESQVSGIAAVLGESADAVRPLHDLITDLGLDPTLKVTAQEAADAIEMLARNGLNMGQIMEGAAKSTILLANSTGGSFAASADIATDALAQFNLQVADMDKAVNQIVGVVNNSKFSLDDYGLALAQAGGVAGALGVEFEDFNTAIASTASLFASGSDAGTSFKTFLGQLTANTAPAARAMMDLGIITEDGSNRFFDAAGNLKGMNDIAVILNESLAGLSEEQTNMTLKTIFGNDAIRTAVGLAGQGAVAYATAAEAAEALGLSVESLEGFAEGGITKFEALQATIGDTDALEAARTRMDNLKGSMEILGGVFDTVKLQIGDAFIPVVREGVEALTRFLTQNQGAIVAFFQGLASGVSTFIGAFRDSLDSGNSALVAFSDALGSVLPPDWTEWLTGVAASIGGIIGVIDTVTQPLQDFIGEWFKLSDVLTALGIVALTVVGPALLGLASAIAGPLATLALLTGAVALVRTAWERDWLSIQTFVTGVVGEIKTIISELWTAFTTDADIDTAAIDRSLGAISLHIKSWLRIVKDDIRWGIQGWWTQLTGTDFGSELVTSFNTTMTTLQTSINNLFDWSGVTITLPQLDPNDFFADSNKISFGGIFSDTKIEPGGYINKIGIGNLFNEVKITPAQYFVKIGFNQLFEGEVKIDPSGYIAKMNIGDLFTEVQISAGTFISKIAFGDIISSDVKLDPSGYVARMGIGNLFTDVRISPDQWFVKINFDRFLNSEVKINPDGYIAKMDFPNLFNSEVKVDAKSLIVTLNFADIIADEQMHPLAKIVLIPFAAIFNTEKTNPINYMVQLNLGDLFTGSAQFDPIGYVAKMEFGSLFTSTILDPKTKMVTVGFGDLFTGSVKLDPKGYVATMQFGDLFDSTFKLDPATWIVKLKISDIIDTEFSLDPRQWFNSSEKLEIPVELTGVESQLQSAAEAASATVSGTPSPDWWGTNPGAVELPQWWGSVPGAVELPQWWGSTPGEVLQPSFWGGIAGIVSQPAFWGGLAGIVAQPSFWGGLAGSVPRPSWWGSRAGYVEAIGGLGGGGGTGGFGGGSERSIRVTPPVVTGRSAASVNVTVNATVSNDFDLERNAYRIAEIIQRRSGRW